jgi:hypothetical protein
MICQATAKLSPERNNLWWWIESVLAGGPLTGLIIGFGWGVREAAVLSSRPRTGGEMGAGRAGDLLQDPLLASTCLGVLVGALLAGGAAALLLRLLGASASARRSNWKPDRSSAVREELNLLLPPLRGRRRGTLPMAARIRTRHGWEGESRRPSRALPARTEERPDPRKDDVPCRPGTWIPISLETEDGMEEPTPLSEP